MGTGLDSYYYSNTTLGIGSTTTCPNSPKFKVGDRVRIIKGTRFAHQSSEGGSIYLAENNGYYVNFDNGFKSYYEDEDLELINKNNNKTMTLRLIPKTLKRVLDKDLQAQYKAKLINGELALTEKGTEALMEILANKYKEELTKEANEIIEEAKEDK